MPPLNKSGDFTISGGDVVIAYWSRHLSSQRRGRCGHLRCDKRGRDIRDSPSILGSGLLGGCLRVSGWRNRPDPMGRVATLEVEELVVCGGKGSERLNEMESTYIVVLRRSRD